MNGPVRRQLFAALLLTAAGFQAAAQTPASAPVGPAQVVVGAAQEGPGTRLDRRAQRLGARLERLKQVLRIHPGQEGAWAAWTQALQPQERLGRPSFVALARMTTPQRIDAMRQVRVERMARLDRRGEATKAFYAALTAEQQATFDEQALHLATAGGGRRHGAHHHTGR